MGSFMLNPDHESVLDLETIATLKALGGSDEPDLFVELVDLFVTDAKTHIAQLQRAVEQHDLRLLERSAHTLKSSCANVGAMAMSKLCFELEQLGRAAKLEGAAQLVARTAEQYERVQVALNEQKAA
jgi:HPt (histidine-containing phosphotransfer) domain-containing protein